MKQSHGVVLATAIIAALTNYVTGVTGSEQSVPPPTPTMPTSIVGNVSDSAQTTPTPIGAQVAEGEYFTEENNRYQRVNEVVRVNTEVGLRKGPSMDSDRAGIVQSGTELTRIGIGDNNWSIVLYNEQQVYIQSYYLRPTDTSEYQLVQETVYATEIVNVRSGGSTDYEIIGMLNAGDEVTRTGIGENGWSCIYYCGEFGYVNSEFLALKDEYLAENSPETMNGGYTKTSETVRAKETVNIRSSPNTEDSIVLGSLNEGETATRLASGANGWSKIDWRGSIAYVKSEFLEIVEK